MRGTTKRSGSSILMVLLIISGILVIVFATQRISLVQFSQSNREEDNLVAYYAAKAGIEDGLARYRFNRDTETLANNVFRFGLTAATAPASPYEVAATEDIGATAGINYDPKEQYYDMKMTYRVPRLGFSSSAPANPDWTIAKTVVKDTTVTLTGFQQVGDPITYYLRSVFRFVGPSCGNAFVQVEQIRNGAIINQTQVRYDATDGITDSRDTNANWEIKTISDAATLVRFRPFFCDAQFALVTSTSTNGTGVGTNKGPDIDSLTTTVTATGYYGASKRTLVADIDRTSGKLIGIYDFNLYAGGGDIRKTN